MNPLIQKDFSFWRDIIKRFPDVDIKSIRSTLRRSRHFRSKKRMNQTKGRLPESCVSAMEDLAREFSRLGKDAQLDAVEEIYNRCMQLAPKAPKRVFWSTLGKFLATDAIKNFPKILRSRRLGAHRREFTKMGLNRKGQVWLRRRKPKIIRQPNDV